MVTCSFCNQKAIYCYKGKCYCKKHFIEYFEKKVLDTIKKYNLINKGERVGVAVSGGKDSISLLYFLNKYKEELGIEVVGIHIDEGIEGYRPILTEYLKKVSKKFGWEIKIYRFKDFFGTTLDNAVKVLKDYKPCTICGVWRRWIMNYAAKELNLDKLATAHNMNDEVQTIVMNLIEGNTKDFVKSGPYVGIEELDLVPRIKPFYFVSEKETTIYAILNGINPPFTECPYIRGQIRDVIRKKSYELENKYEGFHEKILRNYVDIISKLKEKYRGRVKLGKCEICGFPTSHKICRACELKISFKKYLEKKFNG